ncbi:phenylalanine--tRNA ligase subunit beta [Crocinitomix catalasitica]|uniref:phenylalanine--tRNA ligase subunit beta n=1 Tax=Crocinitomix catalasitica TaxID=184607 RepID=UPI000485B797|nr:phenylalanine--tRNA ligase subunit beta [Crocinitomix catalasitica]
MKISYNWLKNYIKTDLSAEAASTILTDTGLEVEGLEKVESVKGGLRGVVIGKVLTKEKHPDADKLSVTTVDLGLDEPVQIVCGAPNVEAGQTVVVATVGSVIYPDPNEPLKIKKSKIRGIESFGMICATDELGLGGSHDGILVIKEDIKTGTPAQKYFDLEDDYLIEIGLTPNRADAMGHIGVARDLKAYLNFHESANLELKWPVAAIPAAEASKVDINIQYKAGAPRYAGATIENITVKPSPDWLQTRLRSIGMKPINNIVDITNFVMHETGNPLHAFDLNIVGNEINVRLAKKDEKITTLDDVDRTLTEDDLVIANKDNAMCIAGVFGGADSGVTNDTKSIFLEAAYFNPVTIRQAAKRQGLNTDSSFRFERGVNPETIIYARDRAISLILELAGGDLTGVEDEYSEKIENFKVDFNFDRCRQLCGVNITNEEIITILNNLDINIITQDNNDAQLEVPNYRVDVLREADVIEEVLRIYGFNKVPLPEKLNSTISLQKGPDKEKAYNNVADYLVSNGYSEIMNNSLVNAEILTKIKSEVFQSQNDVQILNPLSNELDVMRQSILFGGLKSIAFNQNRQRPDVKLFEFGKVYSKRGEKYIEEQKLGIWLTGKQLSENWNTTGNKTDFYQLKQVVENILNKLGILKGERVTELKSDLLEDGYTIQIANQATVEIGWINAAILKEFEIKDKVFYAEFNWDKVIDLLKLNKISLSPIPKTQFVRRDFSLLLDKAVKFDAISAIATKVDRKILKEVGLFDVYEGKNLEEGKKSYAVSFIFQDNEKTLTDGQIDKIMDKIRLQLEQQLKAELR